MPECLWTPRLTRNSAARAGAGDSNGQEARGAAQQRCRLGAACRRCRPHVCPFASNPLNPNPNPPNPQPPNLKRQALSNEPALSCPPPCLPSWVLNLPAPRSRLPLPCRSPSLQTCAHMPCTTSSLIPCSPPPSLPPAPLSARVPSLAGSTGDMVYPAIYCPELLMEQAFTSQVHPRSILHPSLLLPSHHCALRLLPFSPFWRAAPACSSRKPCMHFKKARSWGWGSEVMGLGAACCRWPT